MRRGAALVALAVTALMLAAWTTAAAESVLIAEAGSIDRNEETADVQSRLIDEGEPPPPPAKQSTDLPGALQLIADLLLLAVATLLIGFVAWAMVNAYRERRRSRRSRSLMPTPDHATYADFLDHTRHNLTTVTTEQSTALREGEPRNAIVACWVAIEDAVETAGMGRDPAETSTELTARVVGLVTIDTTAIEALGSLYREARFSRHELGEGHRERAIALLTTLADELDRSRPAASLAGTTTDRPGDSPPTPPRLP